MVINYDIVVDDFKDFNPLAMIRTEINIITGETLMSSESFSLDGLIDNGQCLLSTPVIKENYTIEYLAPLILGDSLDELKREILKHITEDIELTFDMKTDKRERDDLNEMIVHSEGLPFEGMLPYLKKGYAAFRDGWNGKGMYVKFIPGYPEGIPADRTQAEIWRVKEGTIIIIKPYFQIKNVDGTYSTWVPSVGDLLAEDWQVDVYK